MNERQSGRVAGLRAAFHVQHVCVAGVQELLASLLSPASGTTDHVQRIVERCLARLHDPLRVELVERHVAGELHVHLAKFNRSSHIDQVQLPAIFMTLSQDAG